MYLSGKLPIRFTQRVMFFLVMVLIVEGVLYKTYVEASIGSTLIHYMVSSLLSLIILIYFLRTKRFILRLNIVKNNINVLFLIVIAWSLFSSFLQTPKIENVAASLLFGLLVIIFFWIIPDLVRSNGYSVWKILYAVSGVISVISFLLAFFGYGFDEDGRLSGVMVSTAVSSNIFFFAVILSAASILSKTIYSREKIVAIFVFIVSFICLFLTRTRGMLIMAPIGVAWFVLALYRGAKTDEYLIPRMLALTAMIVSLIYVAIETKILNIYNLGEYFSTEVMRLSDGSIFASRFDNWLFGLERIANSPIIGDGFVAKYTEGGSGTFGGFGDDSTYDQFFDPHSVLLYLATSGGIPFIFAMVMFIGTIWVKAYKAMKKHVIISRDIYVYWVFTLVMAIEMIPGGGSLISFGNLIDRAWWMMLGALRLCSQENNRL